MNDYKIKANIDLKQLSKYGFVYTGNWARGDWWTKKVDDDTIREITIDGETREVGFGFPYMDIEYSPIEKYIQDLIENNIVEKR